MCYSGRDFKVNLLHVFRVRWLPPPQFLVGVIGKTNVGKSTFFAAATLITVAISNRPFTTIEPNIGIGYIRKKCVHVELGLEKCDPKNSICIKGYRFIPVKLMDVAGLIPGAHLGRGLGNKFLDDLRQADALIHVVDAAGATDEEGNPVSPGIGDPVKDVVLIEREVDEWFYRIISKDWSRFARYVDSSPVDVVDALTQRLSGLSIKKYHVIEALRLTKLENTKLSMWREEELRNFAKKLREISKPMIIAANKSDLPEAEDNIKRMKKELPGRVIVPVSSEAELALRRAAKLGLIDYLPGDPNFKIIDESKLTSKQLKALEIIRERVLKKWGYTGVQQVINTAFFNVLKLITVYPVEDHNKYTDHYGNVLPDAYLVREGTTARELAYMVHTDLGKSFIYAINAKTKQRVGEDYVLKDNDVIKIVAGLGR